MGPFKAYDLRRKNLHTIPSPPTKIHQHRVDKREWAASTSKGRKKVPKRKAAKQTKRPISKVSEIMRADEFDVVCMHCGKPGDDPECGIKCYRDFRNENFPVDFVDIRGPAPLGYGAYTRPGVQIKKDQWLGEYLGDLRPLETETESLYCFVIPNKCVLDAEKAGNWTRFMNSHCRPNVQAWPDWLGKRNVMLFKAKKDIGPEEELTFSYGKHYFKKAGFSCKCSACQPPPKSQNGRSGVDSEEIRRIIDAL